MLIEPDQLDQPSAWIEHIPFACWLIEAHRPTQLVELGTYFGASYFAFCQAVTRLGLPTRCYAVDTWRGDQHSGFYEDDVFATVTDHNKKYGMFSELLRCRFDEALPYFLDGSIDLLHIDGMHAYDAVRHDFESWLPKLSSRAVVLFHDTNVREHNFGVFRLWAELSQQYPHFEFLHGHGLGVLGVGAEIEGPLRALLTATRDPASTTDVREVFWRLAGALRKHAALNASHADANRLAGEVAAGEAALVQRESELAEAKCRADKLEVALAAAAERDAHVAALEATVAALRASTSWRATSPFRWVASRLAGIRRWLRG